MRKQRSIRDRLIASIFLGCLIPYLLGGIFIKKYTDDWVNNNNDENANRILSQISQRVDDSIIIQLQEQVSMLVSDERVQLADETIKSYVDYNEDTFENTNSEVERDIVSYFASLKDTHLDVNFVFLGTDKGGYIEYPEISHNEPYDPTVREWYINTINSDDVVISDPYITKVTNEMIISFTKKVKLKDSSSGVVGISVNLNNLTESINALTFGKSGYVVVLNSDNKVIISPKNKFRILEDIENVEFSNIFTNSVENSFEVKLDGTSKLLNIYTSPYNQWKYILIVDKSEVLSKSIGMTNILIFTYLLTFVVIFFIIFIISKRITNPILDISYVIDKMAKFDFNFYENKNFEQYLNQNDEIGVITKSLSKMHDNFIELKNSVTEMDIEIKNFDIERDNDYKLTLSERNPFVNIALSVNTLLEKVQSYLQLIRESNAEILSKNQLLKATEEELIAQIDELDSQRDYINFLAYHDSLTNLPNRRKFIEKLEYSLTRKTKGAVILLDLDNFKSINDTLGHVFGDKVLQKISELLNELSTDNIFVSRFGGDEFLILFENVDDIENIKAFIDHIVSIFKEKIIIDQNEVDVEFSMGISLFPKDSNEINQLIMNADLALYSIKDSGKNGYAIFDDSMTDNLMYTRNIENIIREAIDNDGFKLVYQPQIDIKTGEVISYEALLRLKDYNIPPNEFIPIAENNGSINRIGRIVTTMAIKQLSLWKKKNYPVKPVAINFSAVQIHDREYLDFILDTLMNYDVSPKLIEIEITENIFLENKSETLVFLNALREAGIKIAIDDFGTGYSSLSYLTFLPIDKIKLDRSLNIKFLEMENIKVMDSLISLAHSLNLVVVAEGIEEYEQVRRLIVGKCDSIQGYYFSKPLEVEDVEKQFYNNYIKSIIIEK